jgi:D-glycero-alpha-D-manno-heptose 1-phosphate guanylyltransferase
MAPVNTRPFLAYLLDYWIDQGIENFVLSVGYKHEDIRSYFGEAYSGASLSYAIEETPLGTGGGLLLAMQKAKKAEFLLVLNGDTLFQVDLNKFQSHFAATNSSVSMAVFEAHEADRFGKVLIDASMRVVDLGSSLAAVGDCANGGVYLMNKKAVMTDFKSDGRNLSLEQDILPFCLNSHHKVTAVKFGDAFIDIGLPDDYRNAASFHPALKGKA